MNGKLLETLEFSRIRERLAELTAFRASRELAVRLAPVADLLMAERMQEETAQAAFLLSERPEFGVRSAHDVRELARRAALGGVLDPAQLLEIVDTIRSGQYVIGVLGRLDGRYRRLQDIAAGIAPLRDVGADIERCLNEQGEVLDRASPSLARVRSELKAAHGRLIERVNSYLTTHRGLLQEPIITMRGDRYVVPVKAEYRGQVKGIVHDQSSSGATYFIEPLEVLELNNAWRSLQIAERHEIERILLALSAQVGARADELAATVGALAELDLVLAKARLAASQRATSPVLNGHGEINLVQARHPLLRGTVVPISVSLNRDRFMLVITGPNTGGKTVALKTIGLLTLMAQAGLQIPAADGSRIACFRTVSADIGDEQSIEQSLSTFSSHMSNIVRILPSVTSHDLVLLDELGAGTDPTEGSALARAILHYLHEQHVTTVATTHYSELKAYAHTQPGVTNASVEFDVATLSPTYRLIVGLPGRSNALAIARRLGLPGSIVDDATQLLSPDQVRVESLLERIAAEERATEHARRAAERASAESAALQSRLEEELAALERRREALLDDARRQAEEEVAEARRRIEQFMTDIQRTGAQRTDIREAGFEAGALLRQIGERRRETRTRRTGQREAADGAGAALLAPGAWVRVRSLNQVAQVVSLTPDRDGVEVRFGQMKARVKRADIAPATKAEASMVERADEPRPAVQYATPAVGLELDVRGRRRDEVAPVVERYLDDAALAGMPYVRIIHGNGTGTLRTSIREHVARHPLARGFQSAEAREGGEGVTVVTLR